MKTTKTIVGAIITTIICLTTGIHAHAMTKQIDTIVAGQNSATVIVSYAGSPDTLTSIWSNVYLANGNFVISTSAQKTLVGAGTMTFTVTGLNSSTSYKAEPEHCGTNTGCWVKGAQYNFTTVGPPVIVTQPAAQSACEGSNVLFIVAATGNPSVLSYQWYKNNVQINGATDDSLLLSGVTSADAASYKCAVSNSQGSVTSNSVALTVKTMPAISSQPQSLTVNPQSNATFAVTASGSNLAYQWQKVNSALTYGTAASMTLSNVAPQDSGRYYVIVSSNAGCGFSSVTSNTATLTVTLIAPVVSITSVSPLQNGGKTGVSVNGYGLNTDVQLYHNSDSSGWVNAGSGIFTYTFTISNYQPCQTITIWAVAKSAAATVPTASMNFNTSLVQPSITNQPVLPSNITASSLIMTGAGNTNGACSNAISKARLQWGFNPTQLVFFNGWQSGLSGSFNLTDSVTGLSPSTTIYYQWRIENALNPSVYNLSNVLSAQTASVTTASTNTVTIWTVTSVNNGSAKLVYKGATTCSMGVDLKARHDTTAALGPMSIEEGNTTIYGSTLTTYTLTLTNLVQGKMNYVGIVHSNNCSGVIDTTAVFSVWVPAANGVEEYYNSKVVQIFPNPVVDAATIESTEKGMIEIVDVLGSVVREVQIEESRTVFDLNDLAPGMYMYRLKSSQEGKILSSGKIVVAR